MALHALSNVDAEKRRGVCARCGPVTVRLQKQRDGSDVWRCRPPNEHMRVDPRKRRASKLRDRLRGYGLTLEAFEAMTAAQDGRCAICQQRPIGYGRLSVDHCHATGKVRGLLCTNCNAAIGMLREDPGRLRSAIRYLEEHNVAPGPEGVRAQHHS